MSTEDEFTGPASSTGVDYKAHLGALLLFDVHSLEVGVKTSLGEKDAIRCDLAVLDGPDKGEEHKDVLVFPRVLISQLRGNVGRKVLGRLGQGEAKPGQNPPWKLSDPTEADMATAREFLAAASAAASPPF
jgi:hypothetical protein